MDLSTRFASTAVMLACSTMLSVTAWSQQPSAATRAGTANATTARSTFSEDAREEARGAAEDVGKAAQLIQRMHSNPQLAKLLNEAKGIFVVPKFGRGAVGVGGEGGVGLLMVKHNNGWSDPAFYNLGGVSVGAQIGGEGGPFVLVLNNDKAVNSFAKRNNWSLDANAGLTVVNWSKAGQAATGKGDVTLWSDVKGLFGGAAIRVSDIKFDQDQTSAYYGRHKVAVNDVLSGSVTKTDGASLKKALTG